MRFADVEKHTLFTIWPFLFLKRFSVRQFVKFGLVGVTNTTIDYTLYLALTRSLSFFQEHFLLANLISFVVAVTNSYFINKYWTFRDQGRWEYIQFSKFVLINAVALVIVELALFILVTHAGMYDLFAKAVAVVIAMFWNFFMNKHWAFRSKKAMEPPVMSGEST